MSPLVDLSSAIEHHQLTPRTPRTASGSQISQLGEGFVEVRLPEADVDDDPGNLQSAPLLASPSTVRSPKNRERRSPASVKGVGSNQSSSVAPLIVGILIGGILLFTLVLSLMWPESLHRYFGMKSTLSSSSPASSSVQAGHVYGSSTPIMPPPHPIEYLKVCAKMHQGYMRHGDYWDTDFNHDLGPDIHHTTAHESSTVCSKTITYMLDGTVGLTADLALMAQAAALARERNRTFLVDDTYWNRGKWTDHFEDIRKLHPGPQPGCVPPPGIELVACPRTARHWVITSRTAKFHFGHDFSDHYEDPYAHELNRLKPIFISSWQSFTSTILPSSANRALIRLARETFSSFLQHEDKRGTASDLRFVSTHIRRGDRKTLSYSFPDRKVPIQNYIDAVKSGWSRLHHSDILPIVYLASDSPEAHEEFVQSYEGVVYSLLTAPDPRLRALASAREYYQNRFDELDLQTRIVATRGMIVDLAVLSGLWRDTEELVSDAVICAISSNICRLAPIGMGWKMAFGHVDKSGKIDKQDHRWIDVDEQGLIIPVWEAFELF